MLRLALAKLTSGQMTSGLVSTALRRPSRALAVAGGAAAVRLLAPAAARSSLPAAAWQRPVAGSRHQWRRFAASQLQEAPVAAPAAAAADTATDGAPLPGHKPYDPPVAAMLGHVLCCLLLQPAAAFTVSVCWCYNACYPCRRPSAPPCPSCSSAQRGGGAGRAQHEVRRLQRRCQTHPAAAAGRAGSCSQPAD